MRGGQPPVPDGDWLLLGLIDSDRPAPSPGPRPSSRSSGDSTRN